MLSLSGNNQNDNIEAFNSTSRYLDAVLDIDNHNPEQIVSQIYPIELQVSRDCCMCVFLTVPRVCLQFVIMVFPEHTHLLFLTVPTLPPHAHKICQSRAQT